MKIEWTDKTISLAIGCTPISKGCLTCYAVKMTKQLKVVLNASNKNTTKKGGGKR